MKTPPLNFPEDTKMDEETFVLVFERSNPEEHSVDAITLRLALSSLGRMVSIANEEAEKGTFKVRTRTLITRPGSYVVPIEITPVIEQSMPIVASSLAVRGTLALGKSLYSRLIKVLEALKHLEGKAAKRIEDTPAGTKDVYNINGNTYNITNNNYNLLRDSDFRKEVANLSSTTLNEGVAKLAFNSSSGEGFEIPRDEAPYYRDNLSEYCGEPKVEIIRMRLGIVSLSFKSKKWKMNTGQGEAGVIIQDEGFLKKVRESKVYFTSNDRLICDVKRETRETESGQNITFEVTKVHDIDHQPEVTQMGLL